MRIPNSSSASARNRPYYSDVIFCDFCGARMVYAREFHAYYCNHCGNSIDPPSKNQEQQQQQQQPQRKQLPQQSGTEARSNETLDLNLDVKYSTTDGITDDDYNRATIGKGGSSSSGNISSRRGCTRAYQFSSKHKTDFERVCAEEDRQMQERGWQITSDRIDIPHSHNILGPAGGDKKRLLGRNNHARINKKY